MHKNFSRILCNLTIVIFSIVWYNVFARLREKQPKKIKIKKLKKVLDKTHNLCYNKGTKNERGD